MGQHPAAAERELEQLKLGFITPVIKAWSGEWCTKANDLAIQVLGGYGYTREYPVEQYWRDNRLNPIHEGANGIQAIDLLGRKAMMDNGAALKVVIADVLATATAAADVPELAEYSAALQRACATIGKTTQVLGTCLAGGQVRLGLANASHYLTVVGHTLIAWMWLQQALVAQRALPAASGSDRSFYEGKIAACRFFFRHELPSIEPLAALLQSLDDTTLAMQPDQF